MALRGYVFGMKNVQNRKSFWRTFQNCFVLALFSSLYSWQPFQMHLPVEKRKIIGKNYKQNSNISKT
jgi:hypothetical protein